MSLLVLGASSGLGRCVAETLAATGHDVVVVSSDARDAVAQAADLRQRRGVRAEGVALDLAAPALDLAELERTLASLGPLDGIIVTAGASFDTDVVGARDSFAESILRANYLGPHRIIEHLLPSLSSAANPVVVGVGSVAACRGRGQNVVYSGAKRALASYFESLRHASAAARVRVQFYVVGYLDTNLSFGRRLPLPPASSSSLAVKIVARLQRPSRVYYFPRYWRGICWLLRLLPWPLFSRIRS